jgi:hypothetical protein
MHCILSCLLVLRQLDRQQSIASQTLPLKVTGTINEYIIIIFIITTSTIIFIMTTNTSCTALFSD